MKKFLLPLFLFFSFTAFSQGWGGGGNKSAQIKGRIIGQIIDSLSKNSILKKVIVPTSLIVVGSIISNSDFEQNLQIDLRNKVGNNYENKIDNFILFAPVGEIYLADILGVKSKNHWFDQSKNLFISNVIHFLN